MKYPFLNGAITSFLNYETAKYLFNNKPVLSVLFYIITALVLGFSCFGNPWSKN